MSADRLPVPEDLDAERSLLATLCAPGNEAAAFALAPGMPEESFVHPGHREVFRALLGLLDRKCEVSPITLKFELEQSGQIGRVGGFQGLVDLLAFDEVGNPRVLVDRLGRLLNLRGLIRVGARLAQDAALQVEEPDVLIDRTSAELLTMVRKDDQGGLVHVQKISEDAYQRVVDSIMHGRSHGLRTGFSRFDAMTGGFLPGQLIILAARPGIGKTALALNWLLRVAKSHRHPLFYSLEMSREEVFNRLLSAHSGVDLKRAMAQRDTTVIRRLAEAKEELNRLPFWIADRAELTVREIVAMVDRHIVQHGVDLVIIDYLQLISSPKDSRGAKQNEAVRVAEISRGLKLLAKDHGVPVVVLSQLNREVEHRQGGTPQLSDLRDSGSLEQDADMVCFLARNMKPSMDGAPPDRSANLVIAKQRNGPVGVIPLDFDGPTTQYHEVERRTDDEPAPAPQAQTFGFE